jgi:hypothetical protein
MATEGSGFDQEHQEGTDDPYGPQDMINVFDGLTNAIRDGLRPLDSNRPNYHGIEKPKIDLFYGDPMVYSHWKNKFLLLYSPDRNLPDTYLANVLHGLLRGEARQTVEAHFTAVWNGDNYGRMWQQLDLSYGTEHVQARCIRDKLSQIPFLDKLALKTVKEFYYGITVQINYYLDCQPHAITDANSPLYQHIREKMSSKVFMKYIEWLDSDSREQPLERTLLTMQAWLLKKILLLQEVETIYSKSPTWRSPYSTTQELEEDSDEDPTHSILVRNNLGENVAFNVKKNKMFRLKSGQKLGPLSWSEGTTSKDPRTSSSKEEEHSHEVVTCSANTNTLSLRTIVCNLSGGPTHKGLPTVALLDAGSTQTYINRDTAVKLYLKRTSKKRTVTISVFNKKQEVDTYSVDVHLTSADGLTTRTISALAIKDLAKTIPIINWSKEKQKFSHLQTVPFEPIPQNASISILIGLDHSSLLESSEVIAGTEDEPTARLTPLGWTCSGPINKV